MLESNKETANTEVSLHMYDVSLPDITDALAYGKSEFPPEALRAGAILCSLEEDGGIENLYDIIGRLNELELKRDDD
jgi:hypothetical protein